MHRFVLLVVMVGAALVANYLLQRQKAAAIPGQAPGSTPAPRSYSLWPPEIAASRQFHCDGRQYCSQMTSRAEAVYFIRNCPDTKMDGDHDGIPCENDSRF